MTSADLPNVLLGTSVWNQATAEELIPHLLKVPAKTRFLSVEPTGPINLASYLGLVHEDTIGISRPFTPITVNGITGHDPWVRGIDWVIVGGEIGPNARPCNVQWIRDIIDQCKAAGVACFVKHLGSRPRLMFTDTWKMTDWPRGTVFDVGADGISLRLRDPNGSDPEEWEDALRVREVPG
jgi:protein gp37